MKEHRVERTGNSEEQVRRVLCSWLALEVLTPQVTKDGWNGFAAEKQGQQRNRQTTASDGPDHWEAPQDADQTPWPPVPDSPEDAEGEEQVGTSVLQPSESPLLYVSLAWPLHKFARLTPSLVRYCLVRPRIQKPALLPAFVEEALPASMAAYPQTRVDLSETGITRPPSRPPIAKQE